MILMFQIGTWNKKVPKKYESQKIHRPQSFLFSVYAFSIKYSKNFINVNQVIKKNFNFISKQYVKKRKEKDLLFSL